MADLHRAQEGRRGLNMKMISGGDFMMSTIQFS
jgi:hypothetical protein